MSGPTPQQREFTDRLALFFEGLSGQRTIGAIWGWLMVCDPPDQSITEIATAMGVSKASVSTLIRQLEQAGYVERVPVAGSRQHHYQVSLGGLDRVVPKLSHLEAGMEAADFALGFLPPDRERQRAQLEELRDFFGFMNIDGGEARAQRFAQYRAQARAERAAAANAAGRPVRARKSPRRSP
jgi:predicted ArsR family transcriptional regulator